MISVFDIYKVGIGPSSSHTFGTMVSANLFINELITQKLFNNLNEIDVHLYGSLALTGYGHGTCLSIELGLEGFTPANVNPLKIEDEKNRIDREKTLIINIGNNNKTISYKKDTNRFFHYDPLEYHPNGLRFVAKNSNNEEIYSNTYFSIGGGFVKTLNEMKNKNKTETKGVKIKYEFKTFQELLDICKKEKKEIYDIVLANEKCFRNEKEINNEINNIIEVMNNTIKNGLIRNGKIQGTIGLKRRAPELLKVIKKDEKIENRSKSKNNSDNNDYKNIFNAINYISMWSFAVSEENASFGRLITAPTNGAAGVIPPVIKFIEKFIPEKYNFENIKKFILVSGIIGYLCKINATISGAEGGCQAEIGTACAMASAGYVACLGGTNKQIENGAIIGLVHNLGLTCDPIGGYVQIPCIERNPVNALKAIQAGQLALQEEKSQFLSLDSVIRTMYETGKDMHCKYRETSIGGLAKFASCEKCSCKH